MSKFYLLFAITLISFTSLAQPKKTLMIGFQMDLIKTDNAAYFQRFQAGLEGNYFFHKKFAATGGFEYWTESRQPSILTGLRWYAMDEAFIRFRGLLGANDFAIGGGWTRPVTDRLRFEAMTDFYFAGDITIRAGFTYNLAEF